MVFALLAYLIGNNGHDLLTSKMQNYGIKILSYAIFMFIFSVVHLSPVPQPEFVEGPAKRTTNPSEGVKWGSGKPRWMTQAADLGTFVFASN